MRRAAGAQAVATAGAQGRTVAEATVWAGARLGSGQGPSEATGKGREGAGEAAGEHATARARLVAGPPFTPWLGLGQV